MGARGRLTAVCSSPGPGTRKRVVPGGLLRADHGLVGDAHAGSARQVSLLAEESIAKMQARGISVGPGDFAENLTTAGVQLHTLPVGARLRIGEGVVLEITQIGKSCHSECDIRRIVGECIMPTEGIFARVVVGGSVAAGDSIEVTDVKADPGRRADGE
jgi:MOSC domain-containing protein YiiM